jgi:membrane-bound serine protease (ClpP class)
VRRLSTGAIGAVLLGLAFLALAAPAAPAASAPPTPRTAASQGGDQPDDARVNVIKVSGLLDPVLVDFVSNSIRQAEDEGAVALTLQLNSGGAVVSDAEIDALTEQMRDADVPVAVWVGPSGSKALDEAADLVAAAADSGMAPGTRITGPDGDTLDDDEAVEAGVVDRAAPTIGLFNVELEGFESNVVDGSDGRPTREPVTPTVFSQLSLGAQLMHTVASPAVAYLLFVIGMALILFEFFTAGVGVAGVVGAVFFILGCYGLAVLPTNAVAIALLVLSMFAFGVDIQTGVPRFWTGVGIVTYVIGTLTLYDGLSLSWITLGVSFLGMAVAMISGMPAMVRTRFATPTIGREWMIGEVGEAVVDVDPDGTVRVRDALWRARVNRATPIDAGDPVRVVGIAGMILEVEPPEGAAKDYRDRSR